MGFLFILLQPRERWRWFLSHQQMWSGLFLAMRSNIRHCWSLIYLAIFLDAWLSSVLELPSAASTSMPSSAGSSTTPRAWLGVPRTAMVETSTASKGRGLHLASRSSLGLFLPSRLICSSPSWLMSLTYRAALFGLFCAVIVLELLEMFPSDDAARQWFEEIRWPEGRICAHCGSERTREATHAKMPYWCSNCRSYFSVKVGAVMEASKIGYRKWAIAFYQILTNLKGISSMKLHRDLGISQTSAWFLGHRIREAMSGGDPVFSGPVEADETYIGGKEGNKHESKKQRKGRGPVGKTAVAGVKDRETNQVDAEVVEHTDGPTLQQFVHQRTDSMTLVFTDEAAAYNRLNRPHEAVAHSVGEYVRDMAHTNG